MSPERFHDLATRWMAARMRFERQMGRQPSDEETVEAHLARLARQARERADGASARRG